ncbi:MAG: hypothetical protein V7K50_23240 [Nostoc sp.]|uniref:hypothetical protein n=1 Tax=Nostoc sp. TaxID=1180 RepID=UPI002FF86B35
MQLLSLTQIFGEGAYQDANMLVIQKASLLGLTPLSTNTAESLLVGILITALSAFQGVITDENNQAITDENNQPIDFDNSEAFLLLKMFLWQPFQFDRSNTKYINNQIIINEYTLDVTN